MDSQNRTDTRKEKLSRLLTGTVLLLGFRGMSPALFPAVTLTAALAVMWAAAMTDWRGWWLTAAGGAALLLGFLCRAEIASHLGELASQIARALTAGTGYYFHAFENRGQTAEGAAAVGLLLGLTAAWFVRAGNPFPMLAGTALVLAGCGFGIFQAELSLAVYLLGVLLILVKQASGSGRPVLWTAGMALALGGCVLMVWGLTGFQPEASSWLEETIHRWRYESGEDPLPEGDVSGAGRFAPSDDAALEITMDQWEGVYLRGFVGSRYTGSGWEAERGEMLADSAELLYTLQKNYFHPFAQLSAASEALDKGSDNSIKVEVLGACKAYSYLPYGIGGVEPDCRALTQPRISGFSGSLCGVEEAYLLQKELSDGGGNGDYLDGESAYRQWVYQNYLELPEDVRELLEGQLGASGQALTTTQAKERVLMWLRETLRYDESVTAHAGDRDLAQYLLEVSPYGWDVHYATLAALALRSLGIPARYVEGYVVRQSTAGAMEAGEALVLTQKAAHAWVEYYLDGIGWIPFEVTPGYENELVYRLPPDGTGVQNSESTRQNQPETEEPPVKQEPDPGSQTRLHATKVVQNILLALVILLVLAFLVRAILLRRKLRRRVSRFREEDSREAMLDCLRYQYELLESMGHQQRNEPIMNQRWEISRILFGEDVTHLLLTAQELCFSDHPIRDEQRRQVLDGLERVGEVWKKQTPLLRRICEKWIRCRVL